MAKTNKGQSLISRELAKGNGEHHIKHCLPLESTTSLESRVKQIEASIRRHPQEWRRRMREIKDDYKLPRNQRISNLEYAVICFVNAGVLINQGINRSFREIAEKPTMVKPNGERYLPSEIKEIYYNAILRLEYVFDDICAKDVILDEIAEIKKQKD